MNFSRFCFLDFLWDTENWTQLFEANLIPKTVVKYIICGISYENLLLSLSVTDVTKILFFFGFHIIKNINHENWINWKKLEYFKLLKGRYWFTEEKTIFFFVFWLIFMIPTPKKMYVCLSKCPNRLCIVWAYITSQN